MMSLLVESLESLRKHGLKCAKGIAEWYVNNQVRYKDYIHAAGSFPAAISFIGQPSGGVTNWQLAFAAMGQMAAGRAFNCDLYNYSAEKMIFYLRSLQIFDPYLPRHYGAIREMTALTPWCYIKDAITGAWGFLEYYQVTGNEEYLRRAELWTEWYFREGVDQQGLPLWGVEFAPPLSEGTPPMLNDMLGDFTGGILNFFYRMYQITGNRRYIDSRFEDFAEFYIANAKQPDGFFKTVFKADGRVPDKDPQGGLHKSNDDFSSLGMLAAYRVTGKKYFLDAVHDFIEAVFAIQRPDGSFEQSCAGIPVVLNILLESEGELGPWPKSRLEQAAEALRALYKRQDPGDIFPNKRGALDEYSDGVVCTRSSAYALIVLLKLFAGEDRFLSAAK